MTNYELLETAYHTAQQVCDPIDFAQRQKTLLHFLAAYVLERHKPVEQKDEEEAAVKLIAEGVEKLLRLKK